MRDPDARVSLGPTVVRTFRPRSASIELLKSNEVRRLADQGRIVRYEWLSDTVIESERIPFVSYPSEWCDRQFSDAGLLQLAISEELLGTGAELKDGSAYNVVFDGCRPLFCDHASFQQMRSWEWSAFHQFACHFSLPLAVSNAVGMRAYETFKRSWNGLSSSEARRILGWRRFLCRSAPLTFEFPEITAHQSIAAPDVRRRRAVYQFLRWTMSGRITDASAWSAYSGDRAHYPQGAIAAKTAFVAECLNRIRPNWVVDLGCNTGEFSELAHRHGASVIAIDSDHAVVSALYARAANSTGFYPVIANIADPTPGRGWRNEEHASLLGRIHQKADVILCLALIHHLTVGASIPLMEFAKTLADLSKKFVLIGAYPVFCV